MLFNCVSVLALWLSCSFLIKLDKVGCVYSMATAVSFAQSSFPESDFEGLVRPGLFCCAGLCFKSISNVKYSWGRAGGRVSCLFP